MPSKFTKSWEAIRAEKPLDPQLSVVYDRLIAAQEQIAQERRRRGESEATIEQAFALSELDDGQGGRADDDSLATLARFVAALGGRLEVTAVFSDQAIVVQHDSGARTDAGPP